MKNFNLLKSTLIAFCLLVSVSSFSNSFKNLNSYNIKSSGFFIPTISNFSPTSVTTGTTVDLISPTSGNAGTVVTITGTNFTLTSTSNVLLGSFPIPSANVELVSTTQLKVTIPCGVTSDFFIVEGIASTTLFTYLLPTISTSLGNLSVCVDATVPLKSLVGTPSGTTFNWSNSNISIGLTASGTGASIPTFTALNSTLEPLTSTITVTPTINGCLGTTKTYTITVNPKPIATLISNFSFCGGANVNQISLTATSPTTGTGTSFIWSGTNNSSIGLNTPSGTTSPIPAFTAINSTSSNLSSDFTVTPTYETCPGTPINFTINVAPQSNGGTLVGSTSVCSGQNSGPLSVSGIIGSIVRWEQSTDGINWTPIANTSAIYTSESLTTTTLFRVAVQNSTCLIAYSNAVTITVNSLPTITGNLTVCSGATTALTGSGTAASANAWLSSNTSIATVLSTGLVTGVSAGTPIITYTNSNGCKTTTAIIVNVLPAKPTLNAIQTDCLAATGTVQFLGLPTSGNWTINPGGYNGSGANYSLSDQLPGTYNFSVSDSNLCASLKSSVTINAAPIIPAIPSIGSIAQPSCTIPSGSIVLNGLPLGNWTITELQRGQTYSDTSSSYTIDNLAPGIYSFTVSNGLCTSEATGSVAINSIPTQSAPTVGIPMQPTCSVATGSVTLSNLPDNWTLTPNIGSAFSGSGISTTISGLAPETYNYTVKNVSSNCVSIASSNVEIGAQPFTPSAPNIVTPQFFITGAKVSDLQVPSGNIKWYSATSGGSLLNPLTTLSTGNYYASETIGSCESSRFETKITVDPPTNAGIVNAVGVSSVCSGDSADLILTGQLGTVLKWQSSSDNSAWNDIPSTSGIDTYTTTNLTSSLYFRAEVRSSVSTILYSSPTLITVNAPSIAGTLTATNTAVCNTALGGPITLSGNNGTVVKWQNSTDRGSSWTDIVSTATVYSVPALSTTTAFRAVVKNGVCTEAATIPVTITVETDPTSTITTASPLTICETQSNVLIEATIANNYSTITWEVIPSNAGDLIKLSDTQIQFTPKAAGIASGTATVRHTLKNTCGVLQAPVDFPITIQRKAIADAGLNVSTCGMNPIQLDGTASLNATTYSWTLPTNITGSLTPANSATPIYTPSVADVANYISPIKFALNVGSGSACSIAGPSLVYATIIKNPVISAGPASTTICEDSTYTVSGATVDSNTASSSWKTSGDGWFTNDGTLSPTYHLGVTDIVTGIVTITLEAIGNFPCSTITSQTVVNITKKPILNYSNQVVCGAVNTPITIAGSIQNAGIIEWITTNGFGSFDDSSIQNPHYTPSPADINNPIILRVRVYNQGGCDTSLYTEKYFNFTINAQPIVSAGIDQTICEGQTYILNTASSSNASITWSAASGAFNDANEINPTFTPNASDTSVTLTIKGTQPGCVTPATDSMVLTIQKKPQAIADNGLPQVICQGDTFYFNATAPNSSSVLWQRVSSGSGGILNNSNSISASYVSDTNEAGIATFSLTANPFPACTNPAITTTQITIIAKPTVSFDVIPASEKVICEGLNYVVNSANATNFSSLVWLTDGDGTFINGASTLNPTYVPGTLDKSNGTILLTLKALNNAPCIANAEDSIELTITKNPIVTVNNTSQDICTGAGIPVPISGPGVTFNVIATNYDGNLNWESSSGNNTGFLVINPLNTTVLNSYTPSPADIANGSVSLTLTASRLSSNCNISDKKTILLKFIKAPQVDAGPSTITICENGNYTSTSAIVSNTTSVVWSSNGSAGTIANPTSLSGMVYTPSATDIAGGSVTLTLTGVGNSCQDPISDDIVISFEKLPVITTDGTAAICINSTTYPISGTSITNNYRPITLANWTSSGTGTFTSSGNTLNPIYTPTDADKSSGQVTLTLTIYPIIPCSTPQIGTLILDFIPEPVASAGVNLNQCETPFKLAATATAGTYSSLNWSTSGSGTFAGGIINSLNPTYIPSATDITNGTVNLTLTANPISPCTVPLSGTIKVSITSLPIITTSNQATICEDASNVEVLNTNVINADSFKYISSTGTIINNPSSLNPTVTPSLADISNGFITLTIEALPLSDCGTTLVTKDITISIVKNPAVNAGTSQTICEGTNITTSDATATFVDIAGGNLLWTNYGGDGTFMTSANNVVTTYQPGPTEIANGSVNLKLTGTTSSPCVNNSVSTLNYTIIKKPTLTVIPAIVSICEDTIYKVQPGQLSVTNLSSVANIVWSASSPATIITTGSLDLEPTFKPSEADKLNGYSILTVSLTPIAPCATQITGTIRVDISKKATTTVTNDLTLCMIDANNDGLLDPKTLSATFTDHNLADPSSILWEIVSGKGALTGVNSTTPIFQPATDTDEVKIRVSVKNDTPCAGVVFKEFTLKAVQKPVVTLSKGTDTVCSSALTYNLTGNTVLDPSNRIEWTRVTPSGTGNFGNLTIANTTYTFSDADRTYGSVTLRLTAYADPLCSSLSTSEDITITIDKASTATISSPLTICAGEPYTATTLNPDGNSVSWIEINGNHGAFVNGTLDTATFNQTPNNSSDFEIQLTSNTTTACATKVVTQMITVQLKPTIDAGASEQYNCSSQPFVISGVTGTQYDSVLWTIDGTNSSDGFSDMTVLNPTFTPTPAQIITGSVVLKITAKSKSPCGIASDVWDTITLHFTPDQAVSFIAPTAICEEDTISLVGTAPNSSGYSWSTSSTTATTGFDYPTALNAVYTPSTLDKSLGKVNLTLTGVNSTCPIAAESIEILIKKKPTADAGAPVSICQGTINYIINDASAVNYDTSVPTNINWTLTGPATIASGTQNQLNPTIVPTPGASGEIVLTLSVTGFTECNSSAVATKTITIVPPPVITIPSTKTICEGTTLVLTNADVSATNSSSVLWAASQGTFSPTNAAATIYTPATGQTGLVNLNLTANGIGGGCSSESRTIALNIIPKPIVNAGIDGSICQTGMFTVSGASIQNNYTSYTWGVSGPATIKSGTGINGASPIVPPVIEPNVGVSGPVTVTLTAIGEGVCPVSVSDNLAVLINPAPTVNAGLDDKLCEGSGSYQLNGLVTNASLGTTYAWSTNGSGTIQATADPLKPNYIPSGNDFNSSTGIKVIRFDLVASSTNGCAPATDFMELTIYAKPTVSAGLDIIDVCEGTSIVLSGATAQNYSSITWTKSLNANGIFDISSSAVNPTYILGSADTSSVTLTISTLPNAVCALTQVAATDEMTIFINKKPSIVASQNETTMCAETFTLPDFVTVSDASSILWTNETVVGNKGIIINANTETPSFTPTADEILNGFVNLKLTALPKLGCSDTAETVIKVNLKLKATANAGNDIVICQGSQIIINGIVTNESSYSWTHNGAGTIDPSTINSLNPKYIPGTNEVGTVTFTLIANSKTPCSLIVMDTMTVTIKSNPIVSAGTPFTICAGSNASLGNATTSHSDTLVWSSSTNSNGTSISGYVAGSFSGTGINPTYVPSQNDKDLGYVFLTVRASNTSCAGFVTDVVKVTIAPGIGVSAGVNETICEGSTFPLSSANSNVTTVAWTSSQNSDGTSISTYSHGKFLPDNSVNPTYIPSDDDINRGYVFLTITGTGNSTCPINNNTIRLDITKKPTVSASDIQMCMSNTAGVALNGTGTNYDTLLWSKVSGPASGYINSGSYFTGLPLSHPTNEVAKLRLVAKPLDGCTVDAVKEITINMQSLPVVNSGTNGSTCYIPGQPIAPFSIIGTSVSNASSSTWATSSSASGIFNIGNPVIYQSYSNSCTPETLTLTANGIGACSASVVSDAITLAVYCTPPSLGTIVGSSTLCQGTSLALYTVAIDSNVQTYNWQVPTGATIVSGQGLNAITVDYGVNAVSGTVSVNGINGCGTGISSTLGITVNQRPTTASITGPQTVCTGTSNTYTASSIANADSYKWKLPDGSTASTTTNTISIPLAFTGDLSVTGFSNSCGLGDASANYAINVIPLPTLTSLAPTPICSNSIFNYQPTSSDSGATITWTRAVQGGISNTAGSGNGLISETLLNTTTAVVNVNYEITMTTANGCTKSEPISVTVNPIPSLTSGTPPTAICSNGTFSYAPTSDFSGDINWSRAMVPGISQAGTNGIITSINTSISETLTNTTLSPITVSYVLSLPAINGCTGPNKIINLIVNPAPNVTPLSSQVVCEGDSIGINFATTNSGGPSSFNWTNNNTNIGLAASGSGPIPTFTVLNPSTTNQVATITVTPWFTNGGISCSGANQTFEITVNPTADVNQPSNQVICNGSNTIAIAFSTTNTTGTTTYAWTNDNPSIGLNSSGNGTIAPFTTVNTTTIPQVATIVVTPTYTDGGKSCIGLPKTFTITVNPNANVAQPISTIVCANSLVSSIFTTTNTIGTTTYAWTNSNNTIGLTASTGSGSITPFTALNSGTLPQVANLEVTPTFTNVGQSCSGMPKKFTITVNPPAQVNAISSITKCKGDVVNAIAFTTVNTIGTTTYTWNNSNPSIGLGASGSGDISSFAVSNSGTTIAIATITVTPTFTYNGTSCTGPVQVFTITVNPSAEMIQPVTKVVCNGESTSINFTTANTGGTTTYDWSSDIAIGMPSLSGSGSIANFTATNTGNYPIVATITVTPTFTNGGEICLGLPKTFTITVNPSADVIQPITPLVLCNGTPTSVTFTTNNTGGTTAYSWTNNTPSIGISTTGTGSIATFPITNLGTAPLTANLSVTPTFTNAGKTCSGVTKNFIITINPTAQVNQPTALVKCIGETTSPIVFTTQNTVGTTTYSWTNDNTSIGLIATGTGNVPSFITVNTGTNPQIANIVVTPTFTDAGVICAGPTKTFTITVNPVSDVSQPTSLILCNGGQSNVNFATGTSGGITSYSWTNSTTSIGLEATGFGSTPTFTATNSGNTPVVSTLEVTPTFTNAGKSCSDPSTAKTFTITVNPSAQVNQPNSEVVCNGGSTTAVIFGTPYTSGITTFAWTNSNPSIGLAASGSGSIASFTGLNTKNTPQVATIVVTPSYYNAGVSCTGPSRTFTITVNPTTQVNQPTAQVICNGDLYSFNFTTSNTGGTTTYSWTNNNPAIGLTATSGSGSMLSFTATNSGLAPLVATIAVTPTYSNGGVSCVGLQKLYTITVNPSADVIQPGSQVVCNGGSTTGITLSSLNNYGTTSYTWTNSNTSIGLPISGTGSIIPSFNAVNTGNIPVVATITVTPTYTNAGVNCAGPSKTFTITVNPTGELNQPISEVTCNSSATTLINFSSNNSGGITTYSWINNNTTIGLLSNGSGIIVPFNAVNTGTTPVIATIDVTPTYTNDGKACSGTPKTFTITVNPSAEVIQPIATTLCNGDTNNIINFSSLNSVGTTTYTWTNSNTSIGLGLNGSGSLPSFTAINSGTSPITSNVVVTPVYTNGGQNCSGSTKTLLITVNPSAEVNQPISQEWCNGATTTAVNFSTINTGGTTTYSWTNSNTTIGLGAIGSGTIPSFTAMNSGATPQVATITVTATYTNAGKSCTTTKTFTITVNPSPTASITGTTSFTVCQNATQPSVTFTGSNATAPYIFSYKISDGLTVTTQTVSTTAKSNSVSVLIPTAIVGNYTVTLLSVQDSSASSCGNSIITLPNQTFVTVKEGGKITPNNANIVSQTLCEKTSIDPIVFDISGSATNSYAIGLPAGLVQSYNTLTNTFTISGTALATGTFNYTVHTSGSINGCDTTYNGTLIIKADDSITLLTPTIDNQNICSGGTIQPITYSLGGGATGGNVTFSPSQPLGINWSITSNNLTISGSSSTIGDFDYTIESFGICDNTTYSGTIKISENPTVSLVSGNSNTTLCIGTSIVPIIYTISPSTAILTLIGNLPSGLTFSSATGITGTPIESGAFPFTVASSTACGNVLTGTLTVNPVQSINLLSGTTNQISCINNAIDTISYTVTPGITGIVINPVLPNGITASLNATTGIVTISGTPTVATILPQNYTITTQGACGPGATATINLDIKPAAAINFISNLSSLNQAVCQNATIVPIRFTVAGGATGIEQLTLPTGLILSEASGVYTISGNPTANGTFTIPITTTGCVITETITISNVNSAVSINLTSAIGTDNQTHCQTNFNTTINPIKYLLVGATNVDVRGLPMGVKSEYNSGTGELIINGIPKESGIFNYSVTTLPCNIIKTGILKISTPISITNEVVTDVSCSSINNGAISLNIIGGVPSTGLYAINWSGPNGFQQNLTSISGLEAGEYIISGRDAIGCPLPTKKYTVLPAQPIIISLVSTTNVTCNNSLGCANFSFSGGSGIFGFSLQYLDPSSQILTTIVPQNNNYYNMCNLKAGLYYLTVVDSKNCSTAPYLFSIYDYSILKIKSISLDTTLCVDTAGKVRVTVTSLDDNLTFYYNSVVVPSVNLGDYEYELSITNPTAPSGIIKVINSQNCTDTKTVNTSLNDPSLDFTSLNFARYGNVSVNESITFTNGLTNSTIPAEYNYIVWDFGDNSPHKVFYNPIDINPNSTGESITTVFHTYAKAGLYPVTLKVYNHYGCSRSITKIVTVGNGAEIMVPTAFSPNQDGINDLFRPSLLGLKEVNMYIYDNFGNLIYEISSDITSLPLDWGWNGIEKSNSIPINGTYRYFITSKTINDKIIEKEGRFLLIK